MRIPSSQKNLLAFALVAGLGFIATLYLIPSGASTELSGAPDGEVVAPDVPASTELAHPGDLPADRLAPGVTPTPATEGVEESVPEAASPGPEAVSDFRAYALPLAELRGLSPETPPGSRVELWVAWEPPITKQPRVQRLLRGAVVDTVVAPVVPEGPTTVELLVPVKDFPDFVFAHRYGSLTAAVIP